MTQDAQTPDIHAGAVGPVRNGIQVGAMTGAAALVTGAGAMQSFLAMFAAALLASTGSQARARLRVHEAAGTQPNFVTGVLLNTLSVLG